MGQRPLGTQQAPSNHRAASGHALPCGAPEPSSGPSPPIGADGRRGCRPHGGGTGAPVMSAIIAIAIFTYECQYLLLSKKKCYNDITLVVPYLRKYISIIPNNFERRFYLINLMSKIHGNEHIEYTNSNCMYLISILNNYH